MNRIMIYNLIFLILCVSCRKDKLSIRKTPYNGYDLKLNGYYYNKYSVLNTNYYDVYFLYHDGVVLSAFTTEESNIVSRENEIRNGTLNDVFKESRGNWGVFKIDGENITIQRWYMSETFPAYTHEGKILNDTTFQITEIYRLKNGKKKEQETVSNMYYFKAFSSKPDSTNKYVK